MKVLVVGGGGRCHAIVDTLSCSKRVDKIFCAPGNIGMYSKAEIVAIKDTDVEGLLEFALKSEIDLTIVGPESALALGIVDRFKENGLNIFGPTKLATQIESSKDFAKRLMIKYAIPTAKYATFGDYQEAFSYIKKGELPIVLKYDGLAAGKGVVIAETIEEAQSALQDMLLDDKFGKGRVVIEEFLSGEEFSFMCFVNGEKVYPMVVAQDHKRAFEGDKGLNTGGMGAYSPVPFVTKEVETEALEMVMKPVARALVEEGVPFCGVLYGGLIKTDNGLQVIEFNARFGDPETEVVLPRMKSDIVDVIEAVLDKKDYEIEWHNFATLGIVMASKGYPESYQNGFVINGLESVDTTVYSMGVEMKDGEIVTSGGRVLIVVGKGENLAEAQKCALRNIEKIECENLFYRRDIGHKVL